MSIPDMTRRRFLVGSGAVLTLSALAATGCAAPASSGASAEGKVNVADLDEVGREHAREDVRRAIRLLFDRNYICENIAQADEIPANTFVPQGVTEPDGSDVAYNSGAGEGAGFYDVTRDNFGANFDEAMATLKKYYDFDEASGKLTNFPTLHYLYSTGETNKAMAEYFQSALAAAGINLELENEEWATFVNTCFKGNYEMAYSLWIMDYTDPISMLNLWTSTSGSNKAKFGTGDHASIAAYDLDLTDEGYDVAVKGGTWAETYDVLIATINREADQDKRYKLMHKAEDFVMATGSICPIFYETQPYLLDERVEGFWMHPLGGSHFEGCTVGGKGDSINVCYGPEPPTFDPALSLSVEAGTTIAHCFAGLATSIKEGESYKIVPDCATELVEPVPNDDGTYTYTYTLRDDLTWSDGQKVTAHDFEFAWRRASSDDLAAGYAELFEAIVGYADQDLAVHALDDLTLEVTTSYLVGYWDQLMSFPCFYPVREDIVADDAWATRPETYVSNGAYEMVEWEHNSHITLKKRAAYHRADEVTMNQIVWFTSDNANTNLNNFESGDWLFIQDIPTNEMDRVKKEYASAYHVAPIAGTFYVCVNINKDFLPA